MAAPRASIAVSVARAGLTVATAFTLARVFAGRSWLFAMVAAAVVPPLCLAWTQRRHWHALIRFAVVGVVGVWLSALVADPSSSVAGIPTRATAVSLGHALSRAPHTLRSAVVPVTPIGSALVLAFVGVFVAAALTYWIATGLDAPVGAFAPSVALFIVVAAMGSGGWVAPTGLYALASLAYLLALAQNDLMTRRTWFHASEPRGSRLAAGGVVIGVIAIALALVAGPSVPGAGGKPVFDYHQFPGNGEGNLLSAPPPILSIKDKLTLGPIQELFTVKSPRAAYWRVIALDWFTDDQAWGVNKATEQPATKLVTPPAVPPGTTPVHQQFRISALDPHWLPAAYKPVYINLKAARVVPDSLTLLVDSNAQQHQLIYDVDSDIPTPSTAVLARAAFTDPREMPQDFELPNDFPQAVRDLAKTITANAATPFARAVALEKYFQSGLFKYTVHTNLGDSPDAIKDFLLHTRKGFCEQFAASFAAMARAVGVPARVAVGYQAGALEADGLFHVTNRNAHAWPEVWIQGAGWIPFEPTPGFSEPTLGIGTGGPKPNPAISTPNTTPTSVTTPASGSVTPTIATTPGNLGNVQTPAAPAPKHHAVRNTLAAVAVVLGTIALGVIAFFAIVSMVLWRRARRRRRDHDPRRRVLGAWAEALDQLRAAGVPPRPSATALEFALRYAPAHGAGDAGPALLELARLQSAAMFAREAPSPDEADRAWEQVDTIRTVTRRNVAPTARWRRILRRRDT